MSAALIGVQAANRVNEIETQALRERIAKLEAERKIDKDILFKQDQTIQLRNTTIAQLEAENAELRLEIIAATGQAQTALEEAAQAAKIKEFQANMVEMMDRYKGCTCITDKEMTCIVHPTTRSLKEYIARLREAALLGGE